MILGGLYLWRGGRFGDFVEMVIWGSLSVDGWDIWGSLSVCGGWVSRGSLSVCGGVDDLGGSLSVEGWAILGSLWSW